MLHLTASLRAVLSRLGGLFGSPRAERDLDDELQFHLEMLEQEHRGRGLSPSQARATARQSLGGLTQTKEAYRDQRGLPVVSRLLQDLRYAGRTFRRNPGFVAATVATLALGIGANSTIFSVVHAVLLRPLPYPAAERIVFVGERNADGQAGNVGWATWDDWRQRSHSFDELALIRSWAPTLVADGEPERIAALRVSWNYFRLLGVRPALGRSFRPEEDRPGAWQEIVLSDSLWRRRFAADPEVVGRTVRMNDLDYRVIGVLPASFEPLISAHHYAAAEMWAPLGYDASLHYSCRSCQHLKALGRLRRGVSPAAATEELQAIQVGLRAEHPDEYPEDFTMTVVPLGEELTRGFAPVLYLLLGAVGFVLLIACANVASLLLARNLDRQRELALRASLGAGRGRLVRQLLTECLVLALAGGLLGLALAHWGSAVLVRLAPAGLPRSGSITLDGQVLAFSLGLSLATGLLCGLAPALRGSSVDLGGSLRDPRGTAGKRTHASRSALVVADLALALVLLAGAALMLRSLERLTRVDPGFEPAGVLTLQFSLIGERYATDEQVRAFFDQLLPRVEAVPGVAAAALAGQVPLGGNGDTWGTLVEAHPAANPADAPALERYSVTPGYLRLMRIPLRRGRELTAADTADAPPVVVVSQTAARQLWPGEDPLGQRIRIGGPETPWRTVVGVAGDVHHKGLVPESALQMYLPQHQVTDSFLVLLVRTGLSEPGSLLAPLRQALAAIDPTVPVYSVATMSSLVAAATARERFIALLLALFAGAALLMAAIGLYGVVAYTVAQRTREVGLRMALGARRGDIVRRVLAGGAQLTATGLALGLAAAFLLTRLLRAQLFEVSATDPLAFATAAVLLAAIALAAHLAPLSRAVRVDPSIALRHD